MSAVKDLTGQVFGKWRVLKRSKRKSLQGALWLCQCSCKKKTKKIIVGKHLRVNKTQSCGCLRLDKTDISGQIFHRLTVLHRDPKHNEFWICECTCGKVCRARRNNLTSGDKKSCGCLNRELNEKGIRAQKRVIDLRGKTFGYWTVLKRVKTPIHIKYKQPFWLCRCKCGNQRLVSSSNLVSGTSKSCGCKNTKYRRQNANNLTDIKFGRWTVIKRDNKKFNKWIVKCSCKNKTLKSVATYDLITNKSVSCGCLFHPVSKWEKEVIRYITQLIGKNAISCNSPIRGMRLRPDILIPDKKLIIECNGVYWHSAITNSVQDNQWRHYKRRKIFEKKGFSVIQLWEDDWAKRSKAIKSYLRARLRPDKLKIWDARKLRIEAVSSIKANKFIDRYHPQGQAYGKNSWFGLFERNKLIACMGFSFVSRPVLHKKNTAELTRYATKGRVRGGASRLLTHFLRQSKQIKNIISFSDNDYFDGNMYEAIGFKFDGEVKPDYFTVWNNQRRHKSFTKRANLVNLGKKGWIKFNSKQMTELDCLMANNIRRAWNSGKKRWVYNHDHS